jgi:hypothetical protein
MQTPMGVSVLYRRYVEQTAAFAVERRAAGWARHIRIDRGLPERESLRAEDQLKVPRYDPCDMHRL